MIIQLTCEKNIQFALLLPSELLIDNRRAFPGQGAVTLEPYGWVATSNAPPEDKHGIVKVYTSNIQRLQAQACTEVNVFKEIDLNELLQDGFASHSALVTRLNRMYVDHLKTAWAPNTLRRLAVEQIKLDLKNSLLGIPFVTFEDTSDKGLTALKSAIVQVNKFIRTSLIFVWKVLNL